MERAKCGVTEGGITLEDLSQHCDEGPWIVGGDEEVGKHLVATRSIQSGEIITGFVSVAIVSTKSVEGCELAALQKHKWQSDNGRHFQYTYRAKYTENEGVWIVPPPDIAVALSHGHPSAALRQALSRRSTLGGMGFLAEHTCCGLHRNTKIELIMQQETVGGGEICLGAAVIADKTIEAGARIAVSYTGGTTMEEEGWDRIFKC
jgi:hypothetical protein